MPEFANLKARNQVETKLREDVKEKRLSDAGIPTTRTAIKSDRMYDIGMEISLIWYESV